MKRLLGTYWKPGSPWFWLAVLGLVVYLQPVLAVYASTVWWVAMPVTLGLSGGYLIFDGTTQLRIRARQAEHQAAMEEALMEMPESVQHMGEDAEGNVVFSITRRNGDTSTFKMPAGFSPSNPDDMVRLVTELTPESLRGQMPNVGAVAQVHIRHASSAPDEGNEDAETDDVG